MCKEYDEGKDEACREYEENRNWLSKAISKMNKVLERAYYEVELSEGSPILLDLLTRRVEFDDEAEDVIFCYEIHDAKTSLYGNGLEIFDSWKNGLKNALELSKPKVLEELCVEIKQAVEEFRLAYVKYAELDY